MRVTFLTNLGLTDAKTFGLNVAECKYKAVVDVSDDVGELLCRRGWAEAVQVEAVAKPAEIKAVPAEPEHGTVEKATADLKAYRERAGKK